MRKFGYTTLSEQIVSGSEHLERHTSELGLGKVKQPTAPSSGINTSRKIRLPCYII